ncbi:endoribonuclease MazF [Salmonella enterica]|nr:endoribonuclease MazF [Salmonella enterica]EKK6596291.1 endoribonuclease MazF [Salmonella enterica]
MVRRFVPDEGNIVWLNFDPSAGHEQTGHRPCVVVSPFAYNRTGMMICCPMTTKEKEWPWALALTADETSVVLTDQVRSVDWRERKAELKGQVTETELAQIRYNISLLLNLKN